MTFTLVGSRYIGSGAYPPPVAGYDLINTTTGEVAFSNKSGTAWVTLGNTDSPNAGLVPVTGATMTGSLGGATGLAPVDSPDFATSAKLDGVNLATQDDVTNSATTLSGSISSKITEAIAGVTSGISTKANVAMQSGVLQFTEGYGTGDVVHPNPPQTIPLPIYPDGSLANETDCKWTVSAVSLAADGNGVDLKFSSGASSDWTGIDAAYVDPTATRTFIATQYTGATSYKTKIAYFIMAVRP